MSTYKIIFLALVLSLGLTINNSYCQVVEDPNIQDIEQELQQGIWHLENDLTRKIQFKTNGDVSIFDGEIWKASGTYEVVTTCNGEQQGNGVYFLKRTIGQAPGTDICDYIENINYNGNDRLVLMTMNQGKIIVYER